MTSELSHLRITILKNSNAIIIGISISNREDALESRHIMGIGPKSMKPVVEPKPLLLIDSITTTIPTIIKMNPVNTSSLVSSVMN